MKTNLLHLLAIALAIAIPSSLTASSAHDDASQAPYADGWDNGDNGGTGFGPWMLSTTGTSPLDPIYSSDSHFIDGVEAGPLAANQLGAPAFGLTTGIPLNSVPSAEATRSFNENWKVGQTFRIRIDGSALEGNTGIGNLFELVGADGTPRYTLATSLGTNGGDWTINGNNTSLPGEDPISVSLTLTSPDTFSGSVSSLTSMVSNFSLNAPLGGTLGQPVNSLRLGTFGTGSSSDGAREMFFNNLELTRVVPEPSTFSLVALLTGVGACIRRR